MGWFTTSDLDRFAAAAGGYLAATAAENTLLLSAAQAVRYGWRTQVIGQPQGTGNGAGRATGTDGDLLFGWWEPPDGSGARAAFIHDPGVPLLVAGRAPETAAALAGTMAKTGRSVCGVDAPVEAADAFAAAWSQRSGTAIRVHRHSRIYRLTADPSPGHLDGTAAPETDAGQLDGPAEHRAAAWPSPASPGPAGRLRVATIADRDLLVDWLSAFAAETGERIGVPQDVADDLIGYGGALIWEAQPRSVRLLEAAQHLVNSRSRDAAQRAEPVYQPVAMATISRPAARTVRIPVVYTAPDRRRNGYGTAITHAASRVAFDGTVTDVVLITDSNRPDRRASRLGYQLIGERVVLRFGPGTGPMPKLRSATRPMPRLPTGPLPRLRR